MISFFKELDRAYGSIVGVSNEELRREALLEIEKLIKSGVWWTGKKAKEFIDNYKLGEEEYARKLDRPFKSVVVTYSRASAMLRGYIGFDCIHKIVTSTSDKEIKDVIIKLKTAEATDILDRSVPDIIQDKFSYVRKEPDDSVDYSMEDLDKEIEFLRRHSVMTILREQESLDTKKLEYIIGVLISKKGYDLDKKVELVKSINRVKQKV